MLRIQVPVWLALVVLAVAPAARGADDEFKTFEGFDSETAPAEYHPPEYFIRRGMPEEFLGHARSFLEEHPDDERAPRILLDMLVQAASARNDTEVKNAKVRLLLEHPRSYIAGYVARTSPAKDVATLLKERFGQADLPLDRTTLDRFSRTIEGCSKEYGPAFLDDEMRVLAALSTIGPRAAAQYRQQIADSDGDAARTLDIALDSRRSARDRYLDLQALHQFRPARAFQTYLHKEELSDDDRANAEVRTTLAANLLDAGKFAAARLLLTELCRQTEEPRVHFWLAWAHATQGEFTEATTALERIGRDAPDSQWKESADRLGRALAALESTLTQQTAEIERVVLQLSQEPVEVLELSAEWKADSPEPIDVYVSFVLHLDAMELMIRSGSDPKIAYRTGRGENRFFLAGEQAIYSFSGRGHCPLATFAIRYDEDGTPTWSFFFKTIPQGSGGLLQSAQNLLKAVAANSDRDCRTQLRDVLRTGTLPEPVRKESGETVLRWFRPKVDEPTLTPIEVRLTDNHCLSSIKFGDSLRVTDIRYGPLDTIALNPPKWPELPVKSGGELGPADLVRFMGVLVSLFDTKNAKAVEKTARKPTTGAR